MRRVARLSPTVYVLGVASFLADVASEMVFPLLPAFLSGTLRASKRALGVIEGVADATSSITKVASGALTDRFRVRKPFVLIGYSLSSLGKPFIALASVWPTVLGLRFLDRLGKGVRTSPRDALIADVTAEGERGRAYGLHRSMDHAGAVVGPLVAAWLLSLPGVTVRHVILLAAIPAALVVLVIAIGVREPARHREPQERISLRASWPKLGRQYKLLLVAVVVFALGNSNDIFLLQRLRDAGLTDSGVALLWSLHHVVKMVATYWGGMIADRYGSRRLIVLGWMAYSASYVAFGLATSTAVLVSVFLAYGLHFGLTEPAEKSLVSRFVGPELRGTAFGWFHGAVGLAALPASVLFGALWEAFGPAVSFFTGAGLALLAAVLLLRVRET